MKIRTGRHFAAGRGLSEGNRLVQLEQLVIHVSHGTEVEEARRTARQTAIVVGFDEKVTEEIVIVASELASNLIVHARDGMLVFTKIRERGLDGVQIESHDMGPGIADVNQALGDGFSSAGGLGYGLGTINRFMDELEINSRRGPEAGTHIICKRWIRKRGVSLVPCPLSFGAATRCHPIMKENGDTFVIEKRDRCALIGVIDGLGHGQFAHRAAQAASQYVESHFEESVASIFRGAGRACRGTRGVVMALARFDWELDTKSARVSTRVSFASVGNIETRVFGSLLPVHFAVNRGIVGVNAREPMVTEHQWEPNLLMVMHSDGLSSHWRWNDFPQLAEAPANVIAPRLLDALAKDNDDATVVVVKRAE